MYTFSNINIGCLRRCCLVLATKIIQVHQNSCSPKVNNSSFDVVLTAIRDTRALPTLLISQARLRKKSNRVHYDTTKINNAIRKTKALIMSLIIIFGIKSIHHSEGFANQHHISGIL